MSQGLCGGLAVRRWCSKGAERGELATPWPGGCGYPCANAPVGCRGKRGSVVFLEALRCGVGGLIKACRGSSEQSAREAYRHVLHMNVTWRRQVRQRALHYSCNSYANILTHASLWQAARPLSALWYQQGGMDSPHGSQGPKMKQR
jgi:hypothetical protein